MSITAKPITRHSAISFISICLLVIIFSSFYLQPFRQWLVNWLEANKLAPTISQTILVMPTIAPTPPPVIELMAWLPWWDQSAVLTSLTSIQNQLTTISPSWYHLSPQLAVEPVNEKLHAPIMHIATKSGFLIIPTLGNDLDGDRAVAFFSQPEAIKSAIDYLIEQASINNYQGYDIDFENIPRQWADEYHQFLRQVSMRFKTSGLLLSVAVPARTGAVNDWELALSHDYDQIGQLADQVRIMAYDYHYPQSPPGPVTPLEKLAPVISYAQAHIPLQKIVLGLPLYGYDWPENDKGVGLTFQESQQALDNYTGMPQRDPASTSLTATYTLDGINHTLWFEDAQSTLNKINLARSKGISRFIFWRLGGEDPETWTLIRSQLSLLKPGE